LVPVYEVGPRLPLGKADGLVSALIRRGLAVVDDALQRLFDLEKECFEIIGTSTIQST